MTNRDDESLLSRRELLRRGTLAGSALLVPAWIHPVFGSWQQAGTSADPLAEMRRQLGAPAIERVKLTDGLTLLSGPGGNVVVLNGPDGKIVVDTFVQTAWPKLQTALGELGSAPIQTVINTHWHFDHADNNANLRKAGAAIVAHENTRTRLTQTHKLLGATFPPAPAEALPTRTFKDTHALTANGEQIALGYIPPAHTDTDIYIRFSKGNVLHLGDLFFNGMYPFIDAGTGGSINGMINAAGLALKLVDGSTRIVPGHGPLATREDLTKYRDMLVTVRDRVQKLKQGGSTLEQVIAAAPTKDLDPIWGKGFMQSKDFLPIVYNTL
jgi:glyoxylase-like metal-dependent hydrolase (beta-lactamase superfamily II)